MRCDEVCRQAASPLTTRPSAAAFAPDAALATSAGAAQAIDPGPATVGTKNQVKAKPPEVLPLGPCTVEVQVGAAVDEPAQASIAA